MEFGSLPPDAYVTAGWKEIELLCVIVCAATLEAEVAAVDLTEWLAPTIFPATVSVVREISTPKKDFMNCLSTRMATSVSSTMALAGWVRGRL
jgi:hypothetical protein